MNGDSSLTPVGNASKALRRAEELGHNGWQVYSCIMNLQPPDPINDEMGYILGEISF
jgi:hypothetical protein